MFLSESIGTLNRVRTFQTAEESVIQLIPVLILCGMNNLYYMLPIVCDEELDKKFNIIFF